MKTNKRMPHSAKALILKIVALMLALCLMPVFTLAEAADETQSDWVSFLLLRCQEPHDPGKLPER